MVTEYWSNHPADIAKDWQNIKIQK